jgi:RNA polymerase sigma-70 factor (ECF subfamily)
MLNNRTLTSIKLNTPLHEIVRGCIDKNRAAQEHLYRLYSAKMYGVCLRYSKNTDEAKDILQDGFIKVFEKIHQFKNTGSIEGWIRKIMVNTALENYRKKSNYVILDQIPDIKEDVEERWDPEIPADELHKMIQNLPERYQMVFNLYVFEEMSHKEIAGSLGITEGTSKSDLSRARNILQQKIITFYKKVAKIG